MSAERSIATFRIVSAAVVLPFALVVLLGSHPLPARVVALLGIVASIGWALAGTFARKRAQAEAGSSLTVGSSSLVVRLGDRDEELAWDTIDAIELDPERLVIILRLEDGRTKDIPPVWRDIGLDDLLPLLEDAWRNARRPSDR